MNITNPILPGFYPDPSIVRVGEDYYIANSSFEWFPGIPIHHSRDLVNWRLIGHALTRSSQLDLEGVADSCGVWAPSLSHHDGKFWLVYTIVRTAGMGKPFKDLGIYLTTSPDILGPWSEPVTLNSIGFDPSLFHDDDGKKWLVNMMWDFRKKGVHRFAGIVMQEYDPALRILTGPMIPVLEKDGVLLEGPNLYKRDGWYYLMLAEGGTGWNHGISMARSRSIMGPYELDPQHSLLTSRDEPALDIQKAGHGELVQTISGDWYLAHLASRPVSHGGKRFCILGRETCLQKVEWSGDLWLRLAHKGTHPAAVLQAPRGTLNQPWPEANARDDFDSPFLDLHWSSLRVPVENSWLDLTECPGWLRLRGGESLHSLFRQSLIARRLQSFACAIETCIRFEPEHFTQMAGLVCYYDTRQHYYLRVTLDEERGKILGIVLTDDGVYGELSSSEVVINDWSLVFLRVQISHGELQFSGSPDGMNWQEIGPKLEMIRLSDDYGSTLRFTGSMVGICAQDLNGGHSTADFDYFEIKSLNPDS